MDRAEKYREIEEIREKIEYERRKLDEMILSGDVEKLYIQSVKVDRLIEQYIDLKESLKVTA